MSSNNVISSSANDSQGTQDKLLGPSYPYYKNIKSPTQLGISDKGDIKTLGKDIDGLISYVEVLVSGKSKASATGGPLGNKFFLQTGAKCIDKKSNNQVDRYIYINNVPSGNIPFISSGMGTNFADFKGLIPGTMSNLNVLNPFGIMQAFTNGATPPCQEITMQTIDINNNSSNETQFVTTVDIQNMDPCNFPNKKNPITNKKCSESFTSLSPAKYKLKTDLLTNIYFTCLASIGIYILYKIMHKSK
jgi:hypothetical protein